MKSLLELDRRHGLRRNGPDRIGTEPAKFVRGRVWWEGGPFQIQIVVGRF